MKIPRRYLGVVFAFFLTIVMVLLVTGVSTAINVGFPHDFVARWLKSWFASWVIAFPSAIVVGPWARRMAERLTA